MMLRRPGVNLDSHPGSRGVSCLLPCPVFWTRTGTISTSWCCVVGSAFLWTRLTLAPEWAARSSSSPPISSVIITTVTFRWPERSVSQQSAVIYCGRRGGLQHGNSPGRAGLWTAPTTVAVTRRVVVGGGGGRGRGCAASRHLLGTGTSAFAHMRASQRVQPYLQSPVAWPRQGSRYPCQPAMSTTHTADDRSFANSLSDASYPEHLEEQLLAGLRAVTVSCDGQLSQNFN